MGYVKVTFEQDDGITQSIRSLSWYDEKNNQAKLEDVLLCLLEDEYESELKAIVKKHKNTFD